MKKIFQRIAESARAKSTYPGFFTANHERKAASFEPAPSYWALIPVRVQQTAAEKNKKPF